MEELEKLYFEESPEFDIKIKEFSKVSDFLIYLIIERGDVRRINQFINEYNMYIDKKFISWAIRHSQLDIIKVLYKQEGELEENEKKLVKDYPLYNKMINVDEVTVCDNCGSEKCPSLKDGECNYDPCDDYDEELDPFN